MSDETKRLPRFEGDVDWSKAAYPGHVCSTHTEVALYPASLSEALLEHVGITDPSDEDRTQAAATVQLIAEHLTPAPRCADCGPGYRVGDDGCRHPAPQAEGDVREAVDWTRESEHGRCGEWQREGVPSRCALRVSHQGRHDFERSSSGALVDHIRMSVPAMLPGIAQRIADAVLSSGLVVPVGERDDVLDEMQRVLAERDAALAIVANVRGEIGRWDGYGHGLYNTHYESQLPCAVCDVLDEFRTALNTTPRA